MRKLFQEWLGAQPRSIRDGLRRVALGGELASRPSGVKAVGYNRKNGYSGYEFWIGEEWVGDLGFAPLQYGGFVIKRTQGSAQDRKEFFEIFDDKGELTSVDSALYLSLLFLSTSKMDLTCPVLSHLYHYLAHEYGEAKEGGARSQQIHLIEEFLREVAQERRKDAAVGEVGKDPAVLALREAIVAAERDPVLEWEERQRAFSVLRTERSRLITTKMRVHRLPWLSSRISIFFDDVSDFVARVRLRPGSNIRGISYRYTFGVLFWFLHTIRANIGYSIALAIYGPFTFYFITQPLNPHAMWAVGHVRSAYLDTVQGVKTAVGMTPAVDPVFIDSVKTTQAAPMSWADRMSNFKNMQIGYEENLVFAARMGRLEQMETQLAFPLVADNAWLELERYGKQVQSVLDGDSELVKLPGVREFLGQELRRSQRLELYVWDRLKRYLLDHPYIVMDESHEQTYRDFYTGRAFVLFRDMTLQLAQREKQFKFPPEFKAIAELANGVEGAKKPGNTILTRLKRNSALFSQKNRFDGRELRSYMQRQWEVLYLLQNKVQEAANFSLMTYTWSVRNAFWIIQSVYAAKTQEVRLLFENPQSSRLEAISQVRRQVDPVLEALFNLMNLEYASIQPELSTRLDNDTESAQRLGVIAEIERSLIEREDLMAAIEKGSLK